MPPSGSVVPQPGRLASTNRYDLPTNDPEWVDAVDQRVEVRLLGPPHVRRDGAPVGFDTRKALALLAHLVLSDGARPRDVLADLLWPDADIDRARGALRRTLSALRSGIGAVHVEATRDHVRLVRGDRMWVDVDEFRRRRDAADLAGAVAVHRGALLEGFVVRDAPGFEDWCAAEAEGLRRELMATLAALADRQEGDGDLSSAIASVRRWLDLDPLHEPAHQALIRLLAVSGDRAGALAQYRECVRTLSRELGVPPLAGTTRLHEEVQRGTLVATATATATATARVAMPATVPAVGTVVPPALVGRSAELGHLRDAYDTIDGSARVVLLEGEAGIGKTRLAEELLRETPAGATTLVTRCHEGEEGLAFGPVVETLRARLRRGTGWLAELDPVTVAEVARLVPEVASGARTPAAPSSPGAEARFLAAVWAALGAAVAGPRPGVWVVDDVQWADEATRGLLSYGLRRLEGHRALVVLARRTPDTSGALRPVVAAAREAGASTLVVPRLAEGDVASLVEQLHPGAGGPDAGRLWQSTEGVPLLLVEYLRSAPGPDDAVPAAARAVLSARLEPVSETGRQVLSAAAVLGRAFAADLAREVSGRTDEETVAALEELVRRGLLREREDDYDFAHHLVRGVVLDETSLARRRLLHARAAAVPGTPAAVAARHLQEAGQDLAAAHASRRAADEAAALFAHVEAADHLRTALRLGHPDRTGVLLALAEQQTALGEYAAALASLEEAAGETDPATRAEVEHRLGRLQHRRGEYAVAVSHLEAALADLPADRFALRAAVTGDLSLAAYSLGEPERADRLAVEAQALAEKARDVRVQCQVQNLLGILATAAGTPQDALGPLERGLTLAEELGEPELRVATLNNLSLALAAAGRPEPAVEPALRALELCVATGDRHREAALHNNLADLFHATGRPDEAMVHLKAAVAIFAAVGAAADPDPQPEIWKLVRW
jgi:DNA-binding SARP family transcriptional activator/tetratricopeptide (TPR) repeat protein